MSLTKKISIIAGSIIGIIVITIGGYFAFQKFTEIKPTSYETMSVFDKQYNQPDITATTAQVELVITGKNESKKLLKPIEKASNEKSKTIAYQVYNLNTKEGATLAKTLNVTNNYIRVSLDNKLLFEKNNPTEKDINQAIKTAKDATK